MGIKFIRLPYPPSEWGEQPDAVFINIAHIISVQPMPGDPTRATVSTVPGASECWQQWITLLTADEVMALIIGEPSHRLCAPEDVEIVRGAGEKS